MAVLRCDGCGAEGGEYATYQAWEDTARRLGWFVGEDVVLCVQCAGK